METGDKRAIIKKKEGAEKVNPYRAGDPKGEQVKEMFDSIAPAYDFMNTAMTFGLHRHWRNVALDAVYGELPEPARILDIATGTGDLSFELHKRYPEARVTGIDLSEGMLKIAHNKLLSADYETRQQVDFDCQDCLDLQFPSDTFDLVTVAYGVRNFENLRKGYSEILRVLRPGGLLCVIELSVPEGKYLESAYHLYADRLIPAIGRRVSGDSRAYRYLPESIAAAPQRKDMAQIMKDCGFVRCRWRSLTMGVVTFYLAKKQDGEKRL